MVVPVQRLPRVKQFLRYGDILMAAAVVVILAMIVIPLPAIVLSLLIIASFAFSLITLLISMYTVQPLQFSAFPSLTILSTVFRLALNVSTTRSILANAFAGDVIDVFGNFVVGGNYVVGFIIFLVIMLANYLVISHGSVRIGEVAARFTLDAMPGKQMAIDADLNAGLINEDEARARRLNLEREADFFGAMDGASRFVQREALLGLISAAINIIGGFVIGMVQLGMPWQESMTTYTRLTIGDGLAASIPAVLMSTATGIMVTNTVSEANLGQDVATQFLAHPRVILIGGIFLFALGLLPGMGWARVILLVLAGSAYYFFRSIVAEEKIEIEKKTEEERKQVQVKPPESTVSLIGVDTLELEIGYALIPLVDAEQGGDLLDRVTMVRRSVALDMGLVVPPIRIRDNMQLKPNQYAVKVKGVEVAKHEILADHYLAMESATGAEKIPGIETKEPAFGLPALWITESLREQAETRGYTVVDPTSVIATHLTEIIKSYAAEILSRQEVSEMVNSVKQNSPAVVDELIPNLLTLGEVQKVLQNLLRERVPVKDIVTILEALSDYARSSRDIETLTEYVRLSLNRMICRQYTDPQGRMVVLTLDAATEQKMIEGLQTTASGTFISLEPGLAQKFMGSLSKEVQKMISTGHTPVLLCASRIRSALKKFLDKVLPNVSVLSYNEIETGITLESMGQVGV